MIDQEKLLCAFIYSAYASGYCGLTLGNEKKRNHMELYKSYIAKGGYYPKKEIEETQEEIMNHVKISSVRDYIYDEHIDIVTNRIEQEHQSDFRKLINSKNQFVVYAAVSCPVNFYEVIKFKDSNLVGKNIISGIEKELFILDGLEKPKLGDLVSGHWSYFLEIVNSLPDFEKYKNRLSSHYKTIKESLKN